MTLSPTIDTGISTKTAEPVTVTDSPMEKSVATTTFRPTISSGRDKRAGIALIVDSRSSILGGELNRLDLDW